MKKVLIAILGLFISLGLVLPAGAAVAPTRLYLFGSKPYDANYGASLAALRADINNTKPGTTIKAAFFYLDDNAMADAFLAAYKRKVNVQIIVDSHPAEEEGGTKVMTDKLIKVLGGNAKAKSFILKPRNSGITTSSRGRMHAKLYTFSKTGNDFNVAWTSSGNPTRTNSYGSWNNTRRDINTTLFNGLNKYFDAIKSGKNQPHYNGTVSSGSLKLYFYPGSPNVLMSQLNRIHCSSRAACAKFKVRIDQFMWSNARDAEARKVYSLWKKGVDVAIIGNFGASKVLVGSKIVRILQASFKGRKLPFRNIRSAAGGYSHNKLVTILAPTWSVVVGGSANMKYDSMKTNADILSTETNRNVALTFLAYFDKMWKNTTVLPKSALQSYEAGEPEETDTI